MRAHFPELDADEAVQRTLIALVRALRTYHYSPEEKGAFHAYLTGMLRHRALGMVKERAREKTRKESLAPRVLETRGETDSSMESVWREALLKSALQQLLADPSFSARTKEVFRRVAVAGESPAAVAEDMGLARNAVDQIKSRLMAKLKKLVAALEEADRTDA